jgi:CspA family cold shock protein
MKGTVKRFYFRKGFGFIEGVQGSEYFFHYSDFTGSKDSLRPGLAVDFKPQQGDKGPCAVAVVVAGSKSPVSVATRMPVDKSPASAPPYSPFIVGLIVGLLVGASATWLLMRLA